MLKNRWFKLWGWVYRPVSWPGLAVILVAAAFTGQVFLAVDRGSHSASDTLFGVFPYLAPFWILTYWVASKTSRPGP